MVQFAQPSPGEREARQESRVPGTGEVLIDVELAPLNLHDLLFIRGYFGGPPVPTVAGDEEVVGSSPTSSTIKSATCGIPSISFRVFVSFFVS
jgi:hypothetical protein